MHSFLPKRVIFETTEGKSILIYNLQEVCSCRCADEQLFGENRKELTFKQSAAFANKNTNTQLQKVCFCIFSLIKSRKKFPRGERNIGRFSLRDFLYLENI